MIAKQGDGADCVGFGYVEAVGTCGGTIDEQTFVAIVGDRALVTGLAPSNITAIRISQNGTQLVETSTRPITMSDDVLFGEFVDVEGPISVEWIDATGVVASTEVAVDFCRTACG